MKTVTIRVESTDKFRDDVLFAFHSAVNGTQETDNDVISFPDWSMMHKILSPNRIALLLAMAGAGELTIREIAARVGRDIKGVHTDVTALLKSGLLEKGECGTAFPYDAIHFDFTLQSSAA